MCRGALVLAVWHVSESAHLLPLALLSLQSYKEGKFEPWECFTYPKSPLEKSIALLNTCNGLAPLQNIGFCCPQATGLSTSSLDSAFAHTCLAQGACWSVKGESCTEKGWWALTRERAGHTSLAYNPFQLLLCWGNWHSVLLAPFPSGQLWKTLLSEAPAITTTTLHVDAFLPRNSKFWRHNLINPSCLKWWLMGRVEPYSCFQGWGIWRGKRKGRERMS